MTIEPGRVWWPAIGLAAQADGAGGRHLRAEYGPTQPGDGDAVLRLAWSRSVPPGWSRIGGRHKGTVWSAAVGPPGERPLVAYLDVRGPFGWPLAQSQVVEPLLALAHALAETAARGVLIPAAALARGERVEVIVGGSGAGKTTLALRAIDSGWRVLGDDRVFVAADGGIRSFPRRHRIYPDIRLTAPATLARLTSADRRAIGVRGAVTRLTRGYVRLPVLVAPLDALDAGSARPTRVTLLRQAPTDAAGEIGWGAMEQAVGDLINADRRMLAMLPGPWPDLLARACEVERAFLGRGWAGIPCHLVATSRSGPVDASVRALARRMGLEP